MPRGIEKRVADLIAGGKSKKEIARILSQEMDRDQFERFLANQVELDKRQAYFAWNLLLVVIVAATTFFRLGKILPPLFEHGVPNVFLVAWGLLVPAVNLCLVWLVYRFHRLGYLYLLILGVLSLLRPETRTLEGLVQALPVIALSGFLYVKLFPKGGRAF